MLNIPNLQNAIRIATFNETHFIAFCMALVSVNDKLNKFPLMNYKRYFYNNDGKIL